MAKVNIHEAKTHFSKLLRRVSTGEEIVIARGGTPVARLVPMDDKPRARSFGHYRDAIQVPDDFDATLPEEVLKEFEGDDPPEIDCEDPPRTPA